MTTIALAGRRIDPEGDAAVRFPLAEVPAVERRLMAFLRRVRPSRIVCSAACGADLLALRAAAAAGVRRRTIVLPFDAVTFRRTSVTDRPGEWGALYDAEIARAAADGDLILLGLAPEEPGAYRLANCRIIEEAAKTPPASVCIVWEGAARGPDDSSRFLADAGRRRGWPVAEIPTA